MGANQRLEFLGDAVLQFVTSRFVFIQFPDYREGALSVSSGDIIRIRTRIRLHLFLIQNMDVRCNNDNNNHLVGIEERFGK